MDKPELNLFKEKFVMKIRTYLSWSVQVSPSVNILKLFFIGSLIFSAYTTIQKEKLVMNTSSYKIFTLTQMTFTLKIKKLLFIMQKYKK